MQEGLGVRQGGVRLQRHHQERRRRAGALMAAPSPPAFDLSKGKDQRASPKVPHLLVANIS